MTTGGLKSRTAKNVSFNAAAKVLMLALQAVANIILTRTLGAGDYGLVGMAMIFMNFFTLFGDMGISNAVIRKEELSDRDVWTGFTVRVGQGILLALVGFACAPIASRVFDNPEVGKILAVYSFLYVINSFGFIPSVHLSRELRYDRLFIPQVGYALGGAVVAISLALAGFRHWSIVFSTIASCLCHIVLLHCMRPSRLKFCLDLKVARHFFNYGSKIFLVGLVSYALLNVGNFVIGATEGAVALGYYTIAFHWGGMIFTLLVGTVSSVLFPTFAKMQGDRERLSGAYLKILEFMALCALLANLGLWAISKEFLYLVLGHGSEKWFASLLALRILCLFGVVKSLLEPGANLMMAVGNTTVPFRATLVAAVLQVGLIYPALHLAGIEGVASLMVLVTMVQVLVYLPALKRHLGLRGRDIMAQVRPALLSALLTGGVMGLSAPWFGQPSWPVLAAKGVTVLVLFLGCYGALSGWRIFRELKGLVKGGGRAAPAEAAEA